MRKYSDRVGVSANYEQPLPDSLAFSPAPGRTRPITALRIRRYRQHRARRAFPFSGSKWGRKDDTFAIAGVVNQISKIHQVYLDHGGLGILVGDGKLPHPGPEEILETYYSVGLTKGVHVTFDLQGIENPAYNHDRGPAPVLSARLHGQF